MKKLNISLELETVKHLEDKSCYNCNYYELKPYGDFCVFFNGNNIIEAICHEDDDFYTYSLGHFDGEEFVGVLEWNGGLDNKKWYTYDTGFDVIAWKEIVLPKESEMTDDLYYRKLESTSTSDLVDMLREKDRRIAELEEENEGLKAFESHCDEIEEDAKAIAKENAELKEKLDKIRKYLVYDIFDRFKYLENLLKISQEKQEELSKCIIEQQKTTGSLTDIIYELKAQIGKM